MYTQTTYMAYVEYYMCIIGCLSLRGLVEIIQKIQYNLYFVFIRFIQNIEMECANGINTWYKGEANLYK